MLLLNYKPGFICTCHAYAAVCSEECKETVVHGLFQGEAYEIEEEGKWKDMPAWLMPLSPFCDCCNGKLFPGQPWEYNMGAYRLAGFSKVDEKVACGSCLSHQKLGVNYDSYAVGDVALFLPEFTYPYCDTKCVCDFCRKEIYPNG